MGVRSARSRRSGASGSGRRSSEPGESMFRDEIAMRIGSRSGEIPDRAFGVEVRG
jgi:hypothetical protein